MKLTIAIPTYNRNEILKANLGKLLPQVTKECRVIIFDNCSDVPVKDSIQNLLEVYSHIAAASVHEITQTRNET